MLANDGLRDQSQFLTHAPSDSEMFENLVSSSHNDRCEKANDSTEVYIDAEGTNENIYFTNEVFELKTTDTFIRACIDSAAQKTVIGKKQADTCCEFASIAPNLRTDVPYTF